MADKLRRAACGNKSDRTTGRGYFIGMTATPELSAQGIDARGLVVLSQRGLLFNAVLAVVKLVAGLVGNAYALVADAIESATDIAGSLVVIGGLRIASRTPDARYPFGYGRAEPIAAFAVAALMLGAAAGVAIEALDGIRTPHAAPAPWTLAVLLAVVVGKGWWSVRVLRAGQATQSVAAAADGWHHRADAITSAAAFVGVSLAVLGGARWAVADDWAALVASVMIVVNGVSLLRSSTRELMDHAADPTLLASISEAASTTAGVLAIEKVHARRSGTRLYIDLHVQADPALSLHDAHVLSGIVKSRIRARLGAESHVLIHMEPFEPSGRGP